MPPTRPIRAVKNQYRGVNAHLHSKLQNDVGWEQFHRSYIEDLMRALQVLLRPLGYRASVEVGLQIQRLAKSSSPESDVTIYDLNPLRAQQSPQDAVVEAAAPREIITTITELVRMSDSDEMYSAVALYRREERGDPVVWIELLSPSNKPTGRHFDGYVEKRRMLIASRIVFIEIDFLHETPPTVSVPSYVAQRAGIQLDKDATPYRISVIDPRTDIYDGQARSRGFIVDEPIPTMTIPLSGSDNLAFDFGVPYRTAFEGGIYGDTIDYAQIPVHFERYRPDDQARILTRMLHIAEKVEQGGADALEVEPTPLETLPLDEAVMRWRTQLEKSK